MFSKTSKGAQFLYYYLFFPIVGMSIPPTHYLKGKERTTKITQLNIPQI